jgi:hypothetical protein
LSAGFQQHASKPIEPAALAVLVARLGGRLIESSPAPPGDVGASLAELLSGL